MRRVQLEIQLWPGLRDWKSADRESDRERRLKMLLARSDELRLANQKRVVVPPFRNEPAGEFGGDAGVRSLRLPQLNRDFGEAVWR